MDEILQYITKEYVKKWDCQVRHLLADFSIKDLVSAIMSGLKNEEIDFFDLTTFARDCYIGSDLIKKEKKSYYKELLDQGFFKKLESFLYSNKFGVCSWAIYTIGKFSHAENAGLLVKAYQDYYKSNNPMLSYRCLGELNWLIPGKAEPYIKQLENAPSITNLLTLFYYFNSRSYDPRYKQLLENNILCSSILANSITTRNSDKIEEKALNFEIQISNHFAAEDSIKISPEDFEQRALDYFNNYEAIISKK